MPQGTDDLHLGLELLPALRRRVRRELLDGHVHAAGEAAPVDAAKPTPAKLLLLREITCRGRELAVLVQPRSSGNELVVRCTVPRAVGHHSLAVFVLPWSAGGCWVAAVLFTVVWSGGRRHWLERTGFGVTKLVRLALVCDGGFDLLLLRANGLPFPADVEKDGHNYYAHRDWYSYNDR